MLLFPRPCALPSVPPTVYCTKQHLDSIDGCPSGPLRKLRVSESRRRFSEIWRFREKGGGAQGWPDMLLPDSMATGMSGVLKERESLNQA